MYFFHGVYFIAIFAGPNPFIMYDIFISCKSDDYTKAENVYHWLVEKGYCPFFAPISLRTSTIQGEPVVFGDEIDDALEQADNMIVFTSNAEYVKKAM